MAKNALDFATEIEKALASGSWRHTELANRIEMYVEARIEARALEQGGEMREALERIIDHAEDWHAHYCEMWGERRKEQQDAILGDILNASALLARESAEPAEERSIDEIMRAARDILGSKKPIAPSLVLGPSEIQKFAAVIMAYKPTEERRPEVDALLWMAEHLMGSSAASTMREWLAEYRAAGRLAVRNASGATIGQYPEEATR